MRDYERLFLHTADAMCELLPDGTILRANRAFETMLGIEPPAELLCCFDTDGARAMATALRALDEQHPTRTVDTHVPESSRWISWQLTRIGEHATVAVGRNVSAHHETARALAEKSSFLHSIIEAEPECVKIVGSDGTLLDMNQAGLRMIGANDRDEAIGQCVYDIIAPEDRERFVAFNDDVCGGQGGELAFDIVGLDGTRRSMETVAVPLPKAPDGDLLHLAITRDVTERRALEGQLRQAQKMEAIGQLAGGIAHDFNNLLTAIIGPAELAMADAEPGSQLAADLRQIKNTGERAARLTQKLLAFARRHVVQLQPTSIAALVLATQEMLERLLGEAYELHLEVDVDTPTVRADRGHLEQVLLNLVVNARDAVAEGGRITVEVGNEEVTPARARELGCEPGRHVAMRVSDNGAGIPADALPHIFDPFFTTKPTGSGTGLGLSTCYGIVAQLGGAIDVRTGTGHGAKFSVLIPAVAEETLVVVPQPLVPPGNGETILVVEDEAVVRAAVSRMLEALGYRVVPFDGAEPALAQLETLPQVALLITDMTMPGMSGRDLARQMHARQPDLPVLFMTGYLPGSSQSTIQDDDDGSEVLQKPFTSRSLSAAVARALSRRPSIGA
ncbi:MAG: ATP-binding protein [Planctomycetota bacterium]